MGDGHMDSQRITTIPVTIVCRSIKGMFLKFRSYHNFANLLSKLSESAFYKENK